MIIYILFAFFHGEMAPQPKQIGTYNTKTECETHRKEANQNVWGWDFLCVKSKKEK